MSFVFLQYPFVTVLFLLAAVSAVPAARLRRAIPVSGGICIVCTVAMLLAALACAVPYEEILLLLLVVLVLFFVLAGEGKT